MDHLKNMHMLCNETDVDQFLSCFPYSVIFKAGPLMESQIAYEALKKALSNYSSLPVAYVRCMDWKEASNYISQKLGVKHQTPQLLVIEHSRLLHHWVGSEIEESILSSYWRDLPKERWRECEKAHLLSEGVSLLGELSMQESAAEFWHANWYHRFEKVVKRWPKLEKEAEELVSEFLKVWKLQIETPWGSIENQDKRHGFIFAGRLKDRLLELQKELHLFQEEKCHG